MDTPEHSARDEHYMARAISLARRAAGRTHPNPLVGCVIVKGDRIVAEGFHTHAGADHGEVAAIKDSDGDLRGCEMFVNHEPCCHHGRTPPCTDAIIEAGIRRVVVGTIDPDPRVSGRGIDILRNAGIEVRCGVLRDRSQSLNAPFFTYINDRRPRVVAKWAMSLDGKIATHRGDSAWISGKLARERVHLLRNTHDAILIGKQTLLADDPRLTCRIESGRDPVRFVVDARLEAPLDSRVFRRDHSPAPTIVLTGPDSDPARRHELESRGVQTMDVELDHRGWLDAAGIVDAIYRRELTSVLVEGGGALLGSLFDAELVDYAHAFVAPRIIGGAHAPTPVAGTGIDEVAKCLHLSSPQIEQLGSDILIRGEVAPHTPTESGGER